MCRNESIRLRSWLTVDISVLTYLITPWSGVLFDNLTGFQLVKKFTAFYETERFISDSQVPVTCPNQILLYLNGK